jgi:tetratricopeptide (TPR) repeat protein
VGCSADVRAAVEAALGERGIAIAKVTLGDDEGPWACIVAAREESGKPASELILSVGGLGEMAEDKLDGILAHLNLGREMRVVHRLHALLWVGGLERLDRFRTVAPDLWGHRSGVALFLSSEDFEVALKDLGPGDVPDNFETLLRETEAALSLPLGPAQRIARLAEKVECLYMLGRLNEALDVVEEAEALFSNGAMTSWERTATQAGIVLEKLTVLRGAGRVEEALGYAASVGQTDEGELVHYFVMGELARLYSDAGRFKESLACFAAALDLNPLVPGGRASNLLARAQIFALQGASDAAVQDANAASEEVEQLRTRSEKDNAWRPMRLSDADHVLAKVSLQWGATLKALGYAHRSFARIVGLIARNSILEVFESVAEIYRRFGLQADARRFAHRAIKLLKHSPGEVAWWTRWLGACDASEHQNDTAICGYESSVALYRTAADAEPGAHRRASWLRDAASAVFDDLAPLADSARCYQEAEALLTLAARAADEASSPEQQALSHRSFAALARARHQWDRADAELLAVLTYAEANWGPYKRAEVLLDLARVARERGDLPRAADHAERAQREVAIDPPEYRNRYVAIAAARELARIRKLQGDLTGAHAALEAALAITEGDGLRLREREVRLDLAELPPPPDAPDRRLDHAQRARAIAQDAAFPVDEAEAMLVIAELHLDGGNARRARAMFDQAIWIVDRIGPRSVRERAERLRDKLGA